jgi:hypothetical protein
MRMLLWLLLRIFSGLLKIITPRPFSKSRFKVCWAKPISAATSLTVYANLWVLSKLNNVDKHRLLITVGAKFSSMDIFPAAFQIAKESLSKEFSDIMKQGENLRWRSSFAPKTRCFH